MVCILYVFGLRNSDSNDAHNPSTCVKTLCAFKTVKFIFSYIYMDTPSSLLAFQRLNKS